MTVTRFAPRLHRGGDHQSRDTPADVPSAERRHTRRDSAHSQPILWDPTEITWGFRTV